MALGNNSKKCGTRFFLILGLLVVALLVSGCTTSSISEITDADHVGKTVTVYGEVKNTIKVGDFSGYSLTDDSGTIRVSSEALPVEGTMVSVTGVLIKDTLFGYYIKTD